MRFREAKQHKVCGLFQELPEADTSFFIIIIIIIFIVLYYCINVIVSVCLYAIIIIVIMLLAQSMEVVCPWYILMTRELPGTCNTSFLPTPECLVWI